MKVLSVYLTHALIIGAFNSPTYNKSIYLTCTLNLKYLSTSHNFQYVTSKTHMHFNFFRKIPTTPNFHLIICLTTSTVAWEQKITWKRMRKKTEWRTRKKIEKAVRRDKRWVLFQTGVFQWSELIFWHLKFVTALNRVYLLAFKKAVFLLSKRFFSID